MSMSRWDPWGDIITLREAMNTLLEESFVRSRPGEGDRAAAGLAVDIEETPDGYAVHASVPGVSPEEVEITVLGNTLRIRGERRSPSVDSDGGAGARWLVRERHVGPFERAITLPTAIKTEATAAEFQDGVLSVTLPKSDAARPRTIPVRGGVRAGKTNGQGIDVTASSGHA